MFIIPFAARQRGVKVRVLTDSETARDKGSVVPKLVSQGFWVYKFVYCRVCCETVHATSD